MATSNATLGKIIVQICVSGRCELFLADVIRWTWRIGKGTPSGGPLWKGGCMFVCAMSHGYVAKGCTAYLFDVVPLICSHLLFSPRMISNSPVRAARMPYGRWRSGAVQVGFR